MTTYAVHSDTLTGTSAARLALTPTLHNTGAGPFWYETDTGLLYLYTSAGWVFPSPREVLAANRTYFVATTGNDSNDGLTVGTPLLTGQAAVNKAARLDMAGFTVTIQFAAGTYGGAIAIAAGVWFTGTLMLLGDETTPSNVKFNFAGSATIRASDLAIVRVRGIQFEGTPSFFMLSVSQARLYFRNIIFNGAAAVAHMYASGGAIQRESGGANIYTISAGGAVHAKADSQGILVISSATITLTGTPNFTSAFTLVEILGLSLWIGCTFVGAATGVRYNVASNGVVSTNTASATFLPGNAAGVTATGGQYT